MNKTVSLQEIEMAVQKKELLGIEFIKLHHKPLSEYCALHLICLF